MPSTSVSTSPSASSSSSPVGGGPKVLGPEWGTVPDLKKVKLKIFDAHRLARKDIFGASDPYVRVDLLSGLGSVVDSVTTSTKKKTLDPVWNEEIEVHISPYLHKYIQLSVFDENRITRDDFLGLVDLDVSELEVENSHPTSSLPTNHFLKPRSSKSKVKGYLKVYAAIVPEDENERGGNAQANNGTASSVPAGSNSNNSRSRGSGNRDTTFADIERVGETPPVETHDLPSVPARAGDDGTESLADIPAESINTDELENLRDMPEETVNHRDVERVDATPLENFMSSMLTLPPNWEERQDANGRTFYVNHQDRTTQWEHPSVTRATADAVGASAAAAAGTSAGATAAEAEAAAASGRTPSGAAGEDYNRRHHISVEDDAAESTAGVAEDTDQVVSQLNRQTTKGDRTASPSGSGGGGGSGGGSTSDALDANNPLPPGWTMKKAPNGRVFFIDHQKKSTTWTDPRTGRPSPTVGGSRRKSSRSSASRVGKHENGLGPLPQGWEERVHKDGRTFFIDHNNKRTTWEDPRLSDPNVSGPAMPYSRDYKWKYDYLKNQLRRPTHIPKQFKMKVRRRHIFEDSFHQLQIPYNKVDLLKASLWIEFDNESGLDYGGLAREWFFLLSKEMFNPYYGFFEYSAIDNYTLQINPYSGQCNEDHLKYFRFIGRVAGMAVYHGKLLDGFFIRPFYKMMLGKEMALKDMEAVDTEYHNSLQWIKDNDPKDLELTFQVEEEKFGATVSKELKPGGANIPVTEENKLEYIQAVINWRFVHRVREQMEAFKNGFNEIVPLHLLRIFDEGELELLLGGIGSIDVRDWRRNTVYKGEYHANHLVIQWFWRLVLSFNNEMRSRLLQFVTGTSRVPMNGFKELYGSNGPKLFTIERWGNPDSFPRAHTCFNRLDLPPYESFEQLREKLIGAIEGSEGFSGVD